MSGRVSGERLLALLLVPVTVAVAGVFALAWIRSVFFEGRVLPSGHDAIYHARRILDAVDAPWSVLQYDLRIHVPEGSWIPWPWGFDTLMALVVRGARDAFGADPLHTLVFLPPALLVLNATLLVAITRRLRLPPLAQWIAAACFALSPLTQNLHGLGMVDHHVLEFSCVLAALWAGLRWFGQPGPRSAAVAGGVLGAANAVHNGLFLLQMPLLATLGVLWLRGRTPEPRAAAAFAAALLLTTLAAALPADAFRAGFVRYDLLSWFHVYVACLSALTVLLLTRVVPGRAGLARIAVTLAVAALPLAREVVAGLDFVTADLYVSMPMPEMRAPFAAWGAADLAQTWRDYGGLIFLLPFGLAGAAVALVRSAEPRVLHLAASALMGGVLMTQQYRFHYFGSFALYLLPLAFLVRGFPEPREQRRVLLACAVACAIACGPGLRLMLTQAPPPGGSSDFYLTRGVYGPLATACAERPGVVLAGHDDGNYVRYLSECSVIANNLILSRQSWDKMREADRLLDLPAAQLPRAAPWVRYVLVRREDDVFDARLAAEASLHNSALRRDLLLAGPPWPPEYVLLGEVRVQVDPPAPPPVLARLFELVR